MRSVSEGNRNNEIFLMSYAMSYTQVLVLRPTLCIFQIEPLIRNATHVACVEGMDDLGDI